VTKTYGQLLFEAFENIGWDETADWLRQDYEQAACKFLFVIGRETELPKGREC
jgi:hypothetical protein